MKNLAVLALVFATLLLAGCLQGQAGDAMEKTSSTPGDSAQKEPVLGAASLTPDTVKKDDAMQKETPTAIVQAKSSAKPTQEGAMKKYSGKVLAGGKAKLLDFNKADFEATKASDSLVVLYFYADWCPICKEEFPKMQQAFNELQSDKVVGFRGELQG